MNIRLLLKVLGWAFMLTNSVSIILIWVQSAFNNGVATIYTNNFGEMYIELAIMLVLFPIAIYTVVTNIKSVVYEEWVENSGK